jgi:hypothetical protein
LKISSYKGKWISITGILSSYKDRPQIEVEMPSQIEILSGMPEAMDRIKGVPPRKRPRKLQSDGMKGRELIKVRVFNYVVAHRDEYPSVSTIASNLGVAVGAVTDVLDELVQQNKIRRAGPTSRAPGRQNVPPGFFPTSGGTRGSGASGAFTGGEVAILKNLYGKPTVPTPSLTGSQQPTSASLATKIILSPNLCAAGVLLVVLSLLLAFLRTYVASLLLAILGGSVVYYALTHYSILVPVKVMSQTSTYALHMYGGRCGGCGGVIQRSSAIVKTDRGWMHPTCTGSAKKSVWRRI